MRVDGWVAGAQGEGLILQGGGRIFRMEPDGTVAQLGIGSIRFVSDDHMVAWTCDERARCRLELWTPGSEPVVLGDGEGALRVPQRSEEHTSELQSLMRTSYAVLCLKK